MLPFALESSDKEYSGPILSQIVQNKETNNRNKTCSDLPLVKDNELESRITEQLLNEPDSLIRNSIRLLPEYLLVLFEMGEGILWGILVNEIYKTGLNDNSWLCCFHFVCLLLLLLYISFWKSLDFFPSHNHCIGPIVMQRIYSRHVHLSLVDPFWPEINNYKNTYNQIRYIYLFFIRSKMKYTEVNLLVRAGHG